MYNFHRDKAKYFNIQYWVTVDYIIPFLGSDFKDKKVLEIGCAEAGVLKAFLDKGAIGTGIELSESRAALAKEFLKSDIDQGRASIINKNIYDIDPVSNPEMKYDYIILKDVIEHIPGQEHFIKKLHDLLLPNGKVFFAYPPWWMPFGGHQQICQSKFLSKLPWFHLLPKTLYKSILNAFNEPVEIINELMDIKSTGVTIEFISKQIEINKFKVTKEIHWLLNPIYVKKFNFKPLQSLLNIPYLRNVYCTAHYVLFERK